MRFDNQFRLEHANTNSFLLRRLEGAEERLPQKVGAHPASVVPHGKHDPAILPCRFEPHFGADLEIRTHGNVFAATAFLQGIALEEVDRAKLDTYDPAYPLTITLWAKKR